LIKALKKNGFNVFVCLNNCDSHTLNYFKEINIEIYQYKIKRTSFGLLNNFQTILNLKNIISKASPDIVITYGIKPNLFVGLLKLKKNKWFHLAIFTGLGFSFYGKSFLRLTFKLIMLNLSKFCLKNTNLVIVQNDSNKNLLIQAGIVSKNKILLIRGSGVDINLYGYKPTPPQNRIVFLVLARVLYDKGITDFISAARIIKNKKYDVDFKWVGDFDESPNGIKENDLKALNYDDVILYCGHTDDVLSYLNECHVFVMPSYHEGLPRATLEAMSVGRAIITTDAPGCVDTVIDEYNGYIYEAGNTSELVCAIEKIITYKNIDIYGINSRKMVLENFSSEIINNQMIELINSIVKFKK
jgi:glycosyltransferase involved in cell wall biosynthesis